MNKSCFVIDTNILVSRLLFPQSIPAQAVKLAIKKGTVLVSDETLQEKVRWLSIPELESLEEALLDFQNISDLESWFNWKPSYTVDEELKITADWFNKTIK